MIDAAFWDHVVADESGCWLWTGALRRGYGILGRWQDGKLIHFSAHRVAYEHFIGAIPASRVLDHVCRTRRCVNPTHAEPVTDQTNILRGEGLAAINAKKTRCPRGHAYDRIGHRRHRSYRWCSICDAARKSRRAAA